jgi:sigma-B regulation protein RsbU (phosphoserine phosphatase)
MVRLEKSALRELVLLRSELALSIIRELSVRLQAVLQPLGYLMHATSALEKDDFAPELLELLTARAGEVTPFAESFKRMVHALTRRRDDRHEMVIAAGLQTAMLPTAPPKLAGVDLAARVHAAHAVGGDFFDWFVLPDGRLACLVADVSGKGVPAALFMAIARTALRSACLVEHGSVGRIITNVNRTLSVENPQIMFVSLLVAVLDVRDGRLEWANAGHPSGLLWNEKEISQLTPTGPILGVDLEAKFESQELVLERGSRLFMYTDGISEAKTPAGELFGEERVIALCEDLADRPPNFLVDAVVTTVGRFSETVEIADDVTCLCLDWRRSDSYAGI